MVEILVLLNCSTNATVESQGYAQCLDDIPAYDVCPYPETCELTTGDNVGLAFGLTIGAGLATTLGALLPFVPFIKRSNSKYLAGGLALAAGVMLYVSFTEIWQKSRSNFCCSTQKHYDLAATGCFFAGILLTVLVEILVEVLQRLDCGCGWARSRCTENRDVNNNRDQIASTTPLPLTQRHGISGKIGRLNFVSGSLILPMDSSSSSTGSSTPTADSLAEGEEVESVLQLERQASQQTTPDNDASRTTQNPEGVSISQHSQLMTPDNDFACYRSQHPDGTSISVTSNTMSENTNNLANASVNELFSNSSLLRMNAVIPETTSTCTSAELKSIVDSTSRVSVTVSGGGEGVEVEGGRRRGGGAGAPVSRSGLLRRNSYLEMEEFTPLGPEEFREVTEVVSPDKSRLKRMGLLTGLAIGLHNFPEGLATFIATLSSPSLGVSLAIAIALHNIPEGVCVSMPVYYATGSKWKGFLWAFLSGVSEPFGALLGWLVLKEVFGPLVYGISFGIIAGMMVFISLKELLPTALKFDKTDGVLVAVFLVIGMLIMAASLLLLVY